MKVVMVDAMVQWEICGFELFDGGVSIEIREDSVVGPG